MRGLGLRLRVKICAQKLLGNHQQSKNDIDERKMDDSELFDVFNVDNNPEPAQKTIQAPPREKPKKQKKSKLENVASKEATANGGVNGKRPHDNVSAETGKDQ